MLKATVDDDDDDMLKSLLNSFPSTTPLPDWYQTREILIKGGLTERNIDRTPSR